MGERLHQRGGLLWGRDPSLVLGLVQSALGAAVLLGVPLDAQQSAGLMLFFGSLISFIVGRTVTPDAEIKQLIAEAHDAVAAKTAEASLLRHQRDQAEGLLAGVARRQEAP